MCVCVCVGGGGGGGWSSQGTLHTYMNGGQHEDFWTGGGLLQGSRDPHSQIQRGKLEDESTHAGEGGAKLDQVVGDVFGNEMFGSCKN